MKGHILAGLFLCSLIFVVGGDAQSPNIPERAVWMLEVIKVQPENLTLAMQYLHDRWMRVMAAAQRRGAVLDYHLMSNAGMVTPGHKVWDQDSILLLTKYKNMDAYLENMSTLEHLANNKIIIQGPYKLAGDLFESLNTQVFIEEPERARDSNLSPSSGVSTVLPICKSSSQLRNERR